VRELSIPQIRVALDACDRRDAALAIQNLETTHAAVAPLMVSKGGASVFEKCGDYLRGIISPKRKVSPFKRLMARAMDQQAQRLGEQGKK
jgi:hypothetical protein